MKVYNTLSNVVDLAQAENGNFGSWDLSGSVTCFEGNCADLADKYIAPFVKVAKTCGSSDASECFPVDSMKGLGSDDIADGWRDEFLENTNRAYLLQDGSSFVVSEYFSNASNEDNPYLIFFVDTNGTKEPNIFGRDVFMLELRKNGLVASSDYLAETTTEDMGGGRIDTNYANCDPNEPNSVGDGCASRLLQEHKMDY